MKTLTESQLKKVSEKRAINEAKVLATASEIPTKGMGATTQVGSDRYPFTIVEVSDTLGFIIVKADKAIEKEGSNYYGNQDYTYEANDKARNLKYTLRKNGRYYIDGESMKYYFNSISVGQRNHYLDPSF